MSKLYFTYRNHVAIPTKKKTRKKQNKKKQKNKQSNKPTTTKHTKTATTYSSPCLHHRWRHYQAIALNDQQVGPTSLALLSP